MSNTWRNLAGLTVHEPIPIVTPTLVRSAAPPRFIPLARRTLYALAFLAGAILGSMLLGGCLDKPDPPLEATSPDAPTSDAAGAPHDIVLAEQTDGNVVPGDAVYCGTSDAWYRAFRPSDFDVTSAFHVSIVHFTAEAAQSAGSVTVALYPYGGPLGQSTLDASQVTTSATPYVSATVVVPDAGGPLDMRVPRAADIAPGAAFVVAISTPQSASSWFHLGADSASETLPSYHASPSCGEATPTVHPGHAFVIDVEGSY